MKSPVKWWRQYETENRENMLNRVTELEDKVRHLQDVYERIAQLESVGDLNRAYGKLALNSVYGKVNPESVVSVTEPAHWTKTPAKKPSGNVRILFHGVFPGTDTRELLKDQTIRAGITQELSVPDGTRFIQIFFNA